MSVLSVANLGKAYRTYRSEWQRFARWFGMPIKAREEHWVLRGVSFSVQPGEAVGIVGQNGAGKSTLLKMIAGTLQPTEGSVSVGGRIAAILELGMGFNPELTGRQNVLHAMGLMGHSVAAIEGMVGAIEKFADIGEYFHQCVRTYSSGMQARLAFAVATAVRPEIIIVDEALAVGDAAFQRKCFRRLEEFVAEGTALLFVSHDIESVKKLCSKALFIASGQQVEFGDAKQVCDLYEKMLFGGVRTESLPSPSEVLEKIDPALMSDCEQSYGDGRASIEAIWLEDDRGLRANVFRANSKLRVCYRLSVFSDLHDPVFALMIKTREGVAVFGTDSEYLNHAAGLVAAGQSLKICFGLQNTLAPGTYYLNCGVRDSVAEKTIFIHRRVDALVFRVVRGEDGSAAAGIADLSAKLMVERMV